MTERFPLAPMAPAIRWLTRALLALPAGFALAAIAWQTVLWLPAVLLVVMYTSVWIWWRPVRFEVGPDGLTLVFPARRRFVPTAQIAGAECVSAARLRERFGTQLRVGAGGLWGGFGWLWSRRGWTEFYVSTLDDFVLIERRGRIPLLISPQRPERMAAAVRARLSPPHA
jgi:hypothetical protein